MSEPLYKVGDSVVHDGKTFTISEYLGMGRSGHHRYGVESEYLKGVIHENELSPADAKDIEIARLKKLLDVLERALEIVASAEQGSLAHRNAPTIARDALDKLNTPA